MGIWDGVWYDLSSILRQSENFERYPTQSGIRAPHGERNAEPTPLTADPRVAMKARGASGKLKVLVRTTHAN